MGALAPYHLMDEMMAGGNRNVSPQMLESRRRCDCLLCAIMMCYDNVIAFRMISAFICMKAVMIYVVDNGRCSFSALSFDSLFSPRLPSGKDQAVD
ncbi:hypothetical protein QR680_000600 [Steinernema hermaphroditum]|uniref:Uncharacterized protein n=1 Tax=Steinernema hermaphroditum TaxID=289476 RepID=A0AA39GVX6_9BILA|nr:hypothetical protein QR680_000600 [Steinernema hermaphroditum]